MARKTLRVLSELVESCCEQLCGAQGYARVLLVLAAVGLCLQIDVTAGTSLPATWDQQQGNMPTYAKQVSTQCQFPCKCPITPENCKAGVPMVKDGCECCYMCARQQGDLCDTKDLCDESKGLYCDHKLDGGAKGFCRAKTAKSCKVDGNTFRDGEEFKMNCSQLCTCQNGQYACSTLCPQEDRPPSKVHCKDPILVKVEGHCCREWMCPHSHSIPDPTEFANTGNKVPPMNECKYETTEWSACSLSCGMGVSLRLTNENKECDSVQERRLCYVRPCDLEDKHLKNKQCKATWKNKNATTLHYGGCQSLLQFTPKYCSTCKKNKCCGPGKTKSKKIEFICPDGKRFSEEFMWIKNCDCFNARKCPFS